MDGRSIIGSKTEVLRRAGFQSRPASNRGMDGIPNRRERYYTTYSYHTMRPNLWAEIRYRSDRIAAVLERKWLLSVILFAEIYLAITAFHALRRFWYDELFTFYMCRLPSMSAVWSGSEERRV